MGHPLHRRTARAACAGLVLACVSASSLPAQDTTAVEDSTWLVGASVGVGGRSPDPSEGFLTIGVHRTQVQHGRLGGELAGGTMPRALVHGLLAFGGRANAVLPLALTDGLFLVPSVGGSLVIAAGSGAAVGEPGVNAGGAILLLGEASAGLRVGVSWHRLRGFDRPLWLMELGLVRARDWQ